MHKTFKALGLILIILISIGIILFFASILFFSLDKEGDCLSSGHCKEGITLNTEHGLITINQANCLKHQWRWNEERKECDVND